MNINIQESKIRTIRPEDRDFVINDGFYLANRAGFEISENCPDRYLKIITTCIEQGWLKPVANIKDFEYVMGKLAE